MNERIDVQRLLSQVRDRAPALDEPSAERITRAVLEALGAELGLDERRRIALELPESWAQCLHVQNAPSGQLPPGQSTSARRLLENIARHEHIGSGRAVEHAQAVCTSLAGLLSPETRVWLEKHAGELASFFQFPELQQRPNPPAHPVWNTSEPETLVRGRPGSRHHPLSEAKPGSQHPLSEDRPGSMHPLSEAAPKPGQQHSVASNDDPHGEDKLSGAKR